MMRRTQCLALLARRPIGLLLLNALAGIALASTDLGPLELIERTNDELRSAIKSNQQAIKVDPTRAIALVDRIVSPHVAASRVAQWTLGKHWRAATPEQRQRFTDAFRRMLLRTYAIRAGEYQDVDVSYLPVRHEANGDRATVRTKVSNGSGPPIAVDYRLFRSSAEWKVYDVVADGISLVTMFRGVIDADVKRYGLDSVIDRLNDKANQPIAKR